MNKKFLRQLKNDIWQQEEYDDYSEDLVRTTLYKRVDGKLIKHGLEVLNYQHTINYKEIDWSNGLKVTEKIIYKKDWYEETIKYTDGKNPVSTLFIKKPIKKSKGTLNA